MGRAFDASLDWVHEDELRSDIRDLSRARKAFSVQRALNDDSDLRAEALLLKPIVEEVCGGRTGEHYGAVFSSGLESKLSDDRGFNPSAVGLPLRARLGRGLKGNKTPAVYTTLCHELAHCAGTNESATSLRGLEISARMAESFWEDSYRCAFYDSLLQMACRTAALKAVKEEGVSELLDWAGLWLGERMESYLRESAEQEAALRDNYGSWVYQVLPYRAVNLAAFWHDDSAIAFGPPPFSWEEPVISAVALLNPSENAEKKIPIPATMRLYWQAKEGI